MRKYMTKEVTFTTIKVARMEVNENGLPVAVDLDPIIRLGDISKDKAQKLISKDGSALHVYGVETDTVKYKMSVKDFIKYATPLTDGEETDEETDDETDEETDTEEGEE